METQKLSFTTKCFDFFICTVDIYIFNDRPNKDKNTLKSLLNRWKFDNYVR